MKLLPFTFILLVTVLACQQPPKTANTSNTITTTATATTTQTPSQPQVAANAIVQPAKPQPPGEVIAALESLKEIEKLGLGMQKLRDKDDAVALSECGDLMRKHRNTVKELRAKIEAFPNPYSFLLGTPAGEGAQCVTCGSGAKDSCARMKTDIAFAEKRIFEN